MSRLEEPPPPPPLPQPPTLSLGLGTAPQTAGECGRDPSRREEGRRGGESTPKIASLELLGPLSLEDIHPSLPRPGC